MPAGTLGPNHPARSSLLPSLEPCTGFLNAVIVKTRLNELQAVRRARGAGGMGMQANLMRPGLVLTVLVLGG